MEKRPRDKAANLAAMTAIESVTLEVPDTSAARAFYTDAFGLDGQIGVREGAGTSTGFRGFTLSLIVSHAGSSGGEQASPGE